MPSELLVCLIEPAALKFNRSSRLSEKKGSYLEAALICDKQEICRILGERQ